MMLSRGFVLQDRKFRRRDKKLLTDIPSSLLEPILTLLSSFPFWHRAWGWRTVLRKSETKFCSPLTWILLPFQSNGSKTIPSSSLISPKSVKTVITVSAPFSHFTLLSLMSVLRSSTGQLKHGNNRLKQLKFLYEPRLLTTGIFKDVPHHPLQSWTKCGVHKLVT